MWRRTLILLRTLAWTQTMRDSPHWPDAALAIGAILALLVVYLLLAVIAS